MQTDCRSKRATGMSEATSGEAGVPAVNDAEVAAAQFLDACQATLFKPVPFNFAEAPAPERIEHVVGIAVKTFLAAYRAG
jgi:hypothetical protein